MEPEELRKAWENFTQNNDFKLNPDKKHVDKIKDNGSKTTQYMTKAMEEKMIAQIRKTRERLWREKIGLGS